MRTERPRQANRWSVIFLILGVGSLAAKVLAQDDNPPVLQLTAEGLRCGTVASRNLSPCMRIGQLGISDALGAIEDRLGQPSEKLTLAPDEELRIYLRPTDH